MLPLAVEKHGDYAALRYKDQSTGTTGSTSRSPSSGETVRELSLGLQELGVERARQGRRSSPTPGPSGRISDFAILCAGATVVPIYQTNSPEECQYVLEHSDSKAVIVEDAGAAREDPQDPRPAAQPRARDLDRADRGRRRDHAGVRCASAAGRVPRGLRGARRGGRALGRRHLHLHVRHHRPAEGLRHRPRQLALHAGRGRGRTAFSWSDEVAYLFLPLAHAFARLIQLLSVDVGGTIVYWEKDPNKIIPNLVEVKPTYFPSVPRMFEKIYATAIGTVEKAEPDQAGDLQLGDQDGAQGPRAGAARASSRARC